MYALRTRSPGPYTRQSLEGVRLVGVGSALLMLVSEYGFADVIGNHVTLDSSRVAAQVVSGIGFIVGGVIFVRRDLVRGLTTAAGVWATAATGMAAGGDLPVLACATTVIYLLVSSAYPEIKRLLARSGTAPARVRLAYHDGSGVLRELLGRCSEHGFAVSDLTVEHRATAAGQAAGPSPSASRCGGLGQCRRSRPSSTPSTAS